MKKVIVIGAGPAGMMAAGICANNGADVILIEKNNIFGKKLRITGKGRCNVTNACNVNEFMQNIPVNSRFLYSAINKFTPDDTINFFKNHNLKLKIERGNRVFPESDNSIDVVNTLKQFIYDSNVKILNKKVNNLIIIDNICKGVIVNDKQKIYADSVILATGGKSYPLTGSTGDGYKFAANAGHTIVDLKPSLIPLEAKEDWCKELQGLSLKNISLELFDKNNKKIIYKDFGEMLFTHFGVSGPVILSASSHIKNLKENSYFIKIDLKPALNVNQLDKRIIREFLKNQNKDFSNSLNDLLPKKLIPVVIKLSKIPSDMKCNQITKSMRENLVNTLKSIIINIKKFRPIEEAIVTSGGIKVTEINPKTMESKIVKSLYFAGEIIDVDAYTGGFNLQIAFSTGYLAGLSAAN